MLPWARGRYPAASYNASGLGSPHHVSIQYTSQSACVDSSVTLRGINIHEPFSVLGFQLSIRLESIHVLCISDLTRCIAEATGLV